MKKYCDAEIKIREVKSNGKNKRYKIVNWNDNDQFIIDRLIKEKEFKYSFALKNYGLYSNPRNSWVEKIQYTENYIKFDNIENLDFGSDYDNLIINFIIMK